MKAALGCRSALATRSNPQAWRSMCGCGFQRREFGGQLEPVEHTTKVRRLISLLPCRALGLHRVTDARAVAALRWFVAQLNPSCSILSIWRCCLDQAQDGRLPGLCHRVCSIPEHFWN